MKNKFITIFFYFVFCSLLNAESLLIEAEEVSLDKNKQTTIFRNNVIIKTQNKIINSEFAEYNKEKEEIILRKNIVMQDELNNIVKAENAKFNNLSKIFITVGETTLVSSNNYNLKSEDIVFDNKNKIIRSKKKSNLQDLDNNRIYLENFEYLIEEKIFKSIGITEIKDKFNNSFEFSQIYIDTNKKEILGTDIKAFINNQDFKINKKNDPRIFANTMKSNIESTSFQKSIFTLCEYREGEKCPPWTLQANKMTHDNKRKTIFYDHAIIKIYDIPIFYLPYLSHPDPSVERRSGFLPPIFSNSKNLGFGMSVPYFFDVNEDKNLTVTNKLFVEQHPLFLGEYHQAFKNSNFMTDFGFTEGYKETSTTKKPGSKSHFFSKFIKNFKGKNDSENSLTLTNQYVSNDKYLKLYKIKSNFFDNTNDYIENSIDFNHSSNDLFFGFKSSIYETLKSNNTEKYEYLLPDITLDKNLFMDEKFGMLDFQTNYKNHMYETNKQISYFSNDLNWESNNLILNSSLKSKFLGKFKNLNYESKNIDIYKKNTTSEFFGALGLISEMDFQKETNNFLHLLTPKMLLRLAPGQMRQQEDDFRLSYVDVYKMDKLEDKKSFETGATATLGFNYEIKKENLTKFDFSVAQIINKKENKKYNSKTSLDEKLSDLVGNTSFNLNEKLKLNYEFAVDQNYNELNYSDFGAVINLNNLDIDFNFIEEDKHIGNKQYFKTKLNYKYGENGLMSFENKRNLLTNSSEFYDLSYEYINDCLRAGLVYRREFYNDSELEPEDTLMFNITLIPFGKIDTPKLN